MADIIQMPPRDQNPNVGQRVVTKEEFLDEIRRYMETMHRVDERVAKNVRKMYFCITIMPFLCGFAASSSILLVRLLTEWKP